MVADEHDADDRHLVQAIWSGRPPGRPIRRPIDRLVHARAQLDPGLEAVRDDGRSTSYGELSAAAVALAGRLHDLGTGPGSVVAVHAAPSTGLVVGALGVLTAGAAYLPLDAGDPPQRLRRVVEDAGVRVVVGDRADWVPAGTVVEPVPIPVPASPARLPGPDPYPDRPAYVIYTSGSTGRPKGVVCHHPGVVDLVADFVARRPLPLGSRCSMWTSPAFDVSVYEMFSALLGGTLVIVPGAVRVDTGAVLDLLAAEEVASAYLPPFMLPDLADRVRTRPMPRLRRLLVGVEPIPEGLLRDLVARVPGLHVINGYGPTETHVCATAYSLDASSRDDAVDPNRRTPIGRPLRHTTVHVLRPDGTPVDGGETGELYVGGEGVAYGYLGGVRETAARFVPDPFAGRPGARMYRTGDHVSRLADGNLVFHGRGDDQVKVNGYRVEPAEVESGLTRLPAVASAVALLRRSAAATRLEAFVTLRPTPVRTAPTGADLRRALQEELPAHLVPATVHVVPALPTTRNGKLDRAALRAIAESGGPHGSGRAPRAGTEEQLIRLAERVLRTGPVEPDAGFLDCGGDSIAALRLATLVRQELRRPVSMAEVLDCTTFGDLAALLESRAGPDPRGEPEPSAPEAAAAVDGDLPLTPSQHGLWLLHQIYPDCTAYHVPVLLRLRGNLDRAALSGALRDVLVRHPALRTSFPVVDGEPVQRRAPAGAVPASMIRVHDAPRADGQEAFLTGLTQQRFDLAAGPLVRADLVRHAPDDHRLLLVVHHLVTDGWSMEILQRDLWAAYTARVTGRAPDWPALDPGVVAQPAPDTEAAPEALDYWRRQFAEPVPEPVLPQRRLTVERTRFPGARFTRLVPESVALRLERVARRERASLFSVLVAALGLVVMRYGDTDRVVVGVPTAGREVAGTEDVVGFFNRTLALCVDRRGGPGVLEYLRRTHRTLADALRHGTVPFEQVVAAVSPPARSTRAPLFRVWCNLLSYPRRAVHATGLAVDAEEPPLPGSLYDLCLYVDRRDDGLHLTVVHDPEVLAADRMVRLGDQLCHVLDQIAADPDRPLDRLVLEPPAPPPPPALPSPTPHATPGDVAAWPGPDGGGDRPAIRAGSVALSHAEVRSRAGALAGALTAAGVGPGDLVAVFTGRTPELGVALLGVRQAGAAFAVLDPKHPDGWLRRSASAAAPAWWLTGPLGRPPHFPDGGAGTQLAGGLAYWPPDPALPPCRLPPEAAYVAFTSGTTGRPHAVLGSAEPVLRFLRWYPETFALTARDRFAVLAGLGHDPLLRELLLPLTFGATACLPPEEVSVVPGRLLDWIRAERITVLHLTPAMARMLRAAARDGDAELPDVQLLALGGAPVTPDVAAAARSLCPAARRISLYGTTETPQGVGLVDLAEELDPPPVGTGVCGAQLLVLDGRMRRAAVNETGEIAVRGTQVALGYLGEPELTGDRFRPDPWGLPDVRVFRTGDRGRQRPDGVVEFLGRLDAQLSVNGQRVEPADIEHMARACAGVQECAVVADAGQGSPVLFVAPTAAEPAEALRQRVGAHLGGMLPAAMQPAMVTVVPRIPLTPNGKVDHAALVAMAAPAAGRNLGADLPDLVPRLLQLWGGLLGQDDLSPDTNFFDAGGTSLTLLRLHDLVQAELGRPVELLTFFRFPTVRRLAEALSAQPGPARRPTEPTRRPGPADRRERRLELRRIARGTHADHVGDAR